jgi:hypothetical protein
MALEKPRSRTLASRGLATWSLATWSLAPRVHAVEHHGDLVLLDTGAGAYFCLPDGAARLRLDPQTGTLEAADAAAIAPLLAGGLVEASARPAPPATALPAAVATALRPDYPILARGDLGPLARASAELLAGYWRRSFADILRFAQAGRPEPPAVPGPGLLEVVDAYHRWVPYAPVSAQCLLRSFMLLRLLSRRGHGARWVFGVRTWPFRAHCWLQCGEVVLDDHPDRVAAFARILVL